MHSRETKKENSEESHNQKDSDYLNPEYQAEQEKKIVDALCQLVKQQSAPNIELHYFDGKRLDFHYFMTLFHEVVKKRIDNPKGKLPRLLKYTSGNRKEMIKHCVQESLAVGYQHTKKILVEKYGNPYHIMVEYRKGIKDWLIIRSCHAKGYQRLITFYESVKV